jgi:hypothetical protein
VTSPGQRQVGPVLEAGETASAVIAAITALNPGTRIEDRGAYLRVLVEGRCVLTREAVERVLGRPFHIPADLEAAMPAFKGKLELGEGRAVWSFREFPEESR